MPRYRTRRVYGPNGPIGFPHYIIRELAERLLRFRHAQTRRERRAIAREIARSFSRGTSQRVLNAAFLAAHLLIADQGQYGFGYTPYWHSGGELPPLIDTNEYEA